MKLHARGFALLCVSGALVGALGCEKDNETTANIKGTAAPEVKDDSGKQLTGQDRYRAQMQQQQNQMKSQFGSSGYPGAK